MKRNQGTGRDISGALHGWLLVLGGLGIGLVLWLAPAAGASARDGESLAKHDFDHLVQAVAGHYDLHPKTVPMMWVANLVAKRMTHGGARTMQVVQFENAERIAREGSAAAEFSQLVTGELGARWSPMVVTHEKKDASFVYVQEEDQAGRDEGLTRLIVVALDDEELNVVSLSLNPDQMQRWLSEHKVTGTTE